MSSFCSVLWKIILWMLFSNEYDQTNEKWNTNLLFDISLTVIDVHLNSSIDVTILLSTDKTYALTNEQRFQRDSYLLNLIWFFYRNVYRVLNTSCILPSQFRMSPKLPPNSTNFTLLQRLSSAFFYATCSGLITVVNKLVLTSYG